MIQLAPNKLVQLALTESAKATAMLQKTAAVWLVVKGVRGSLGRVGGACSTSWLHTTDMVQLMPSHEPHTPASTPHTPPPLPRPPPLMPTQPSTRDTNI